jgi:hypothetical protein
MSKMGSHCPFGHLKHKLWAKERSRVKVRNRPNFLVCKRCETYRWKVFDQGYNFASNLITIGGLHAKLCASKVAGIPAGGIWGLPLGSLGTKSHLDVAPMEKHRVYYKGKGSGFPQVRAVVSFVCPNCPWLILALKVFQLCTKYFVLVCASLCK